MNFKMLVSSAVLFSLCWADENCTVERSEDTYNTLESSSNNTNDLEEHASVWRLWRQFRPWGQAIFKQLTHSPIKKESERQGGRLSLHHDDRPKIKNKRTITRRDSSLITNKKNKRDTEADTMSEYQAQISVAFTSESSVSVVPRAKGSVQKELVTMMFESMLSSIVDSWELIVPQRLEPTFVNPDVGKSVSETFTFTTNKKKKTQVKASKSKRSRSKLELLDNAQESQVVSWWSSPDEKAIIRFKNGNLYEGNISMKCMHGEGRFQWADGTIYLGQFNENEMCGKGLIQWSDDTWYQGEFVGNLRHGQGLYVDSRLQRSYSGQWYCGTKHGDGAIYFTRNFKNSYDGQWIHNERCGYGAREYCASSGYKGDWMRNVREGKGLMIWPNNDFYRGEWQNGVMSGSGIYIWESYYNNTMSLPSLLAYRGSWDKGERNGYGKLNLGLGLGSHYKGEFKNNKKNGAGIFVTNNGLILQDKNIFIDNNLRVNKTFDHISDADRSNKYYSLEPFEFDICDNTVGFSYHIEQALKNMDKQEQIIAYIIDDYLDNNSIPTNKPHVNPMLRNNEISGKETTQEESEKLGELISFEETSFRKSLKCYETDLRNIYYKYATICNSEVIYFTPVMIRLFLWQLYYDCDIHKKGLTLFDIDMIFFKNSDWLVKSPHDPFEKIYYWQFLHSLISIANKLYAKRVMPGLRPDTILASAFRTFMESDVLPGSKIQKGRLVNGYGAFIPLKATYELYQSIGEPHTILKFLRSVRHSPHFLDRPAPPLIETPDEFLLSGYNAYMFGDELSFIVDKKLPEKQARFTNDLYLFNIANLSSKAIIKIFNKIFPQISENHKIMDLNVKLTFFEFFEAFVDCIEQSIIIKEEELKWRKKFTCAETAAPHSTPTGYGAKSKNVF